MPDAIFREAAYWAKRGCTMQGWAGESDAAKWCKKRERQLLHNGSHDVGATDGSHIPDKKPKAKGKMARFIPPPIVRPIVIKKKESDGGAAALASFNRIQELSDQLIEASDDIEDLQNQNQTLIDQLAQCQADVRALQDQINASYDCAPPGF